MLPRKITVNDLHDISEALSTALDAKSSCMCGHSERVAALSLILAREIGLSQAEQTRIHIGAHLHDVGKIGIPDAILNKPGRLTETEFAIIRQHPAIGDNIIGKIKVLRSISDIVRYHHERYDGAGYPDGLCDEEIPLGARIVAVADAFDAMTTLRSYRLVLDFEAALEEMKRCRGTQFDPDIVDLLVLLSENRKLPVPGQDYGLQTGGGVSRLSLALN
ncbi:MAG: HD-GYP domain-containing protein [Negativicutes bacterium]|nr:HD-GYP domain-containing protein [Negativicutes bacterium]